MTVHRAFYFLSDFAPPPSASAVPTQQSQPTSPPRHTNAHTRFDHRGPTEGGARTRFGTSNPVPSVQNDMALQRSFAGVLAGVLAAAVVTPGVQAQYGGFGGGGGFGQRATPCPKFKCPEGQTPMPRVGMTVHSSG